MIAVGRNEIGKAFIGGTEICRMYLGDTRVFGDAAPVLPYNSKVEYLRSSGAQYINTGIVPNSTTKFIIYGTFANNIRSGDHGILASGNRFHISVFQSKFHFGVRSSYLNAADADRNAHIFELNGSGTAKIDDTSYTVSTRKISATTAPIYLFARDTGTSVNTYTNGFELYYCKIYNSGELVRDFIPVRKDGVGDLFDKVSEELFGNLGTGSFTYGNDV